LAVRKKMFKNRSQWNNAQIEEWLSAYLDDMLGGSERVRLEARLAQEPALRERLEGLRMTVEALAALPALDVPRNFILSPAMAAQPRPAPRPRRRQTWPVFGWATAAAALLLVVVLAGDLGWARPAQRTEAGDRVALAAEPTALREMLTVETETLAQEKAAEPPVAAVAEEMITVAPAGEPAAPTAAERVAVTEEAMSEQPPVAAPAPSEAPVEAAQAPFALAVTPTLGVVVTAELPLAAAPTVTLAMAEADAAAAVIVSPSPAPQVVEPAPTPTLAPAALPTEQAVPGEESAPATPQVVAAQPETEASVRADEQEGADDTPAWLRLFEVVLAASVIGLAVTAIVLRRRETRR